MAHRTADLIVDPIGGLTPVPRTENNRSFPERRGERADGRPHGRHPVVSAIHLAAIFLLAILLSKQGHVDSAGPIRYDVW